MTKYSFCNNCGKQGHQYHQCKRPITSIGIVTFRYNDNAIEFLLICRKNTLGYVDFMRGKYKLYNKLLLENLIDEMTIQEKKNILEKDFLGLWKDLWGNYIGMQYRNEEASSKDKFTALKSGIQLNRGDSYTLRELIENSTTTWKTPEWGFPKGRRNYQENDIMCALREFEEETGYNKDDLNIIQNIIPFEEIFTGSNFKSYKHKYYIACMGNNIVPSRNFQESEVSEIQWCTLEKANTIIRPYNLEKKDVLQQINKAIERYRLIS